MSILEEYSGLILKLIDERVAVLFDLRLQRGR